MIEYIFTLIMRYLISIFLLTLFPIVLFSQPFQVKGYVKDKSSGDILPNAHVFIDTHEKVIVSNNYGFFSFSSKKERVIIKISYAGYETLENELSLKSDTIIDFLLFSDNLLGEVEIKSSTSDNIIRNEVGALTLTGRELEKIPSLLGEHDIVKALQLMPGIRMGREGTSGMHVRGGSPGENLILLDDVPVYNVNHLFGFFSVFTPEAVKSVDVYKGSFPARYGGRISSVMDVRMREGNLYKTYADLTVGTISSKIIFETPLKKGKSSLLISGRRTYLDLILAPIQTISSDKTKKEKYGYSFYDLNAKLFIDIGKAGKLYWSYYSGQDNMYFKTTTDFMKHYIGGESKGQKGTTQNKYNWGNYTTSLRWNKAWNKLFVNGTLFYTYYSYKVKMSDITEKFSADTVTTTMDYNNISDVKDYGAYFDFDFFISDNNHLTFGTKSTSHNYIPGKAELLITDSESGSFKASNETKANAIEVSSYIEDRISIGKSLKIVAGLHHSYFKTDSKEHYSSFQPRVRASWEFRKWAFKLSGGYMVQPVHNLVNNSTSMAVDIWIPSTGNIKPSSSLQFDAGANWLVSKMYSLSAEIYWRKMNNVLTYKNGESFLSLYENWTQKVISGRGESYGLEILARKSEGRTTGWAGYTWSVSNRQFSELNNGNLFPYQYDRRHFLTIVVNHTFSKKVQLSGSWVYGSGEPLTVSSTTYSGDPFYGNTEIEADFGLFSKTISSPDKVIYYSGINNYRLPSYHRLDLGIDLKSERRKGTSIWSFSIYNVYGRNNPFMVNIEENKNGDLELKNISLFRFLPSVSYRFIFK
jgi:hypothetical protein